MSPGSKKALDELWIAYKYDLGLLCIIFVVVFLLKDTLSFNDVKDVVGTLQTISAAMFTIVGLWVGFLYPNAIQSIVNDNVDYIKNSKDVPRIEKLIYVIIVSALVMLGTLVFYMLKSLFYKTVLYHECRQLIRIVAFVLVYVSCWLQARCIFSVIKSNLRFVSNLHARISESRIKHD
ncbi:hypothetical protein [Kosakonia cowanii]|uniref:hypothetical protein n=1 Tax=Kosakonia cowanii TaxID=208223 RepID=UPI002FDE5B84